MALAVVGAASVSHAAPYVASFDPAYGTPFNDLGWRGTSSWTIADQCFVGASAGVISIGAGDCTATMSFTEIDFYSISDPLAPTLAKVVFDATNGTPVSAITAAYYTGGLDSLGHPEILGIDATITGFATPLEVVSGSLLALFGNNVPDFAVEFNLGTLAGAGSEADGPYNGPLLYWQRGQGCSPQNNCNGTNDTPPDSFIINGGSAPSAAVPEPAGIALTLVALAAAFGATRGRRNAA